MEDALFSTIGKVITSLGGGAFLLLALSSWLGKVWAKRILNKEIEEIRNKFKLIETEYSIKFSSLHSKRAEIIAEIYSLLTEIEVKSRILATPPNSEEKDKIYTETFELINLLLRKFDNNRIYLTELTCEKINDFIYKSSLPLNLIRVSQYVKKQDPEGKIQSLKAELDEKFLKQFEETEKKLPEARKALEEEFRKILGVY